MERLEQWRISDLGQEGEGLSARVKAP